MFVYEDVSNDKIFEVSDFPSEDNENGLVSKKH